MTSNIIAGLYRHAISRKLYNVIGVGRSVENPNKRIVIYKQMYASKLRGTDEPLPIGSIWTRDLDDFDRPVYDEVKQQLTKRFIKVDD